MSLIGQEGPPGREEALTVLLTARRRWAQAPFGTAGARGSTGDLTTAQRRGLTTRLELCATPSHPNRESRRGPLRAPLTAAEPSARWRCSAPRRDGSPAPPRPLELTGSRSPDRAAAMLRACRRAECVGPAPERTGASRGPGPAGGPHCPPRASDGAGRGGARRPRPPLRNSAGARASSANRGGPPGALRAARQSSRAAAAAAGVVMETAAGPVAMETVAPWAPGGRRRWEPRRHALLAVIGEIGTEPERGALRAALERGEERGRGRARPPSAAGLRARPPPCPRRRPARGGAAGARHALRHRGPAAGSPRDSGAGGGGRRGGEGPGRAEGPREQPRRARARLAGRWRGDRGAGCSGDSRGGRWRRRGVGRRVRGHRAINGCIGVLPPSIHLFALVKRS